MIVLSKGQIKQLNLWRVLHNDYDELIDSRLKEIHTNEIYQEYYKYINPTRNPVKRIAEILSVTYLKAPRRYIKASNKAFVNNIIRNNIKNLNQILREVEKQINVIGDCYLRPYMNEKEDMVELEVIPAYLVKPAYDRSTLLSLRVYDEKGNSIIYYNDGTFEELNVSGKAIKERTQSKVDYLPIVHFAISPTDEKHPTNISDNQDIYNATLQIGLLETYLSRVNYLRSFRQPKASTEEIAGATGTNQADLTISPSSVIPYDLDTVELASPSDEYLSGIRELEIDASGSRGISSDMYYKKINNGSEDVITNELRQYWFKSIQTMRTGEQELLRLCVDLYLLNTGKAFKAFKFKPYDYIIDYIEPIPELMNPLNAQKVLSNDIKLGTDNVVDYLLRTNPDIPDEKTALKLIEKNINMRAKMVEKMRELNMPADVLNNNEVEAPEDKKDVGETPDMNGDKNYFQKNTL